jgi:hypothetical protein
VTFRQMSSKSSRTTSPFSGWQRALEADLARFHLRFREARHRSAGRVRRRQGTEGPCSLRSSRCRVDRENAPHKFSPDTITNQVEIRRILYAIVVPGSRANRTLLPSVWSATASPASVLIAARKLKDSWILLGFPLLIR